MPEEKDDFNDRAVEEFRQNIQKLYAWVKNWLKGLVFKEVSVDIYEEYAVPYKISGSGVEEVAEPSAVILSAAKNLLL